MAALRWTAVAAVTGVLASHSGPAAAQDPVPTPTATPVPTATPTPVPLPVPVPPPPAVAGTVIYIITVTTTTTTTAINAPITWVAAPITTNVSNTSATTGTTANNVTNAPAGTPASDGASTGSGQTELSLSGCGRRASARAARRGGVIQTARIRVPSDAQVVLRVNGKPVGNLQLDPGARKPRGIPLRVELAASGTLSVYRPSGRILKVQACTPK